MESGNTPVAIHNEYAYSKGNPSMNINSDHLEGHTTTAHQYQIDHSVQNQKDNLQADQDQIGHSPLAVQSDMNQPEVIMLVAGQSQIGQLKNKRGRPKKMKRKMPLTLEKETKRVQEQKRKSYIKHKLG